MLPQLHFGMTLLIGLLIGPAAPPPAHADDATSKLYGDGVRSMVWIVIPKGKALIMGSGTLIDAERRLILTNYHVVGDNGHVFVSFPMYDKNGKLISERDPYVRRLQNQQTIRAAVLYYREESDLAVVQADSVPADARALPLATASVAPGEPIVSLGNPGAGGNAMWLLTKGIVRAVSRNRYKTVSAAQQGMELAIDARVVIAQSPNNPGDSGGPMLNSKGELAAVTQGGRPDAQEITYFIDILEVREFLTKAGILGKDGRLTSAGETRPVLKSSPPPAKTAAPRQEAARPAIDPNDPKARQELAAAPSLDLAYALYKEERYADAKKYCDAIIADYPGTVAAQRAKELLGKLKDK
jgi:S1-C subfamily serine protease